MTSRVPFVRAVVTVLLSLSSLSACGDAEPSAPSAGSVEPSQPALDGLRFEEPDGSVFTVAPSGVTCAAGDEAPDVTVVQVRELVDGRLLRIEVAPVEEAVTVDLAVGEGDAEAGSSAASLFLGSDDYEVSTATERSSGRLEVLEAACDPARLRLRVTGTLGSEYIDGDPLAVSGGVDLGGTDG